MRLKLEAVMSDNLVHNNASAGQLRKRLSTSGIKKVGQKFNQISTSKTRGLRAVPDRRIFTGAKAFDALQQNVDDMKVLLGTINERLNAAISAAKCIYNI